MSRSLREYLAENADRLRVEKQRAVVRRDEWVAAVDELIVEIRRWLGESDPDHLFSVTEVPHTIDEEGIGHYEVKGLKIVLGPRVISSPRSPGRWQGPGRIPHPGVSWVHEDVWTSRMD
jgi:hypothetical protein